MKWESYVFFPALLHYQIKTIIIDYDNKFESFWLVLLLRSYF